ncbi:hypothetical protein [Nakamurella sp.]|uniref:hypothetical protein n=1 Tax=Nakamurella sp. TaxID=1869182 RepID=UPI003782D93F
MSTTAESLTKLDRYRITYRYLRAVMVAVLLLLVISVAFQAWQATCVLTSISAYYYTPVQAVFIGSLFALGAALIAYQGESGEEEAVLNLSGFMALVVAIVPTGEDNNCGANVIQRSAQANADAVLNNIVSLLAVGVVAGLVLLALRWKRGEVPARAADRPATGWRRFVIPSCIVVPVAELMLFLFKRDDFVAKSHGIAAVTMVIGLVLVMWFNAYSDRRPAWDRKGTNYRLVYRLMAVAMVVALLGTTGLFWGRSHLVLALELVVIVIFGAYWIVQSVELRGAGVTAMPPGGDDDHVQEVRV